LSRMISTQIRRAGICALSLSLWVKDRLIIPEHFLDLVLSTSARWRELHIDLPDDMYPRLECIGVSMLPLQLLQLRIRSNTTSSFAYLVNSTAISTVDLCIPQEVPALFLPWASVNVLKVSGPFRPEEDSHKTIIHRFPNLHTLHVWPSVKEALHQGEQPLTLPTVRSIFFYPPPDEFCRPGLLCSTLSHLCLPSLENLSFKSRINCTADLPQITQFIQQSALAHKLKSLYISLGSSHPEADKREVKVSAQGVLDVLTLVPGLEELTLYFDPSAEYNYAEEIFTGLAVTQAGHPNAWKPKYASDLLRLNVQGVLTLRDSFLHAIRVCRPALRLYNRLLPLDPPPDPVDKDE
jgi:hypothetical protein